jgi:ABC-type antimicrobial peptide transport system permease subunit
MKLLLKIVGIVLGVLLLVVVAGGGFMYSQMSLECSRNSPTFGSFARRTA